MTHRILATLGSLNFLILVGWGANGKESPAGALNTPAREVFGLTRVHEIHLELSAREWEKMQPAGGRMPFPGRPPGFGKPGGPNPPKVNPEKPGDIHKGGGFGMEFPWAQGRFATAGKTYNNVAVRFKGNASYLASARGLRRNLKIELDRYDRGQRFHGLKTLTLNAGAMDATRLREALSYAVFRAAGVPAPRTAFVALTLSVPGKYDKEFVGLYTLVEHVDRTFLEDRFQTKKGLLMKPERLRGLEYLGEDWNRYQDRYRPKREPSKKEARRLIDFVRLVHQAGDESFRKEIGSYLDINEVLRFVAVNAFLVNLDSFLTMGHNFYIYLNPQSNRFVFLPWDLDLSLGGFPMMGSPEKQLDLSLVHPYPGQNKLLDRLLAIPAFRENYQKVLKELAAGCFAKEKLLGDIEAMEKVTRDLLVRERKAAQGRKEGRDFGPFGFGPPGFGPAGGKKPGGPGGPFGPRLDPRTFVVKRTESIADQLAGKSKGFIPTMGFGPGRPGGPGGFGPGLFPAKPLLNALDADKDGKVSRNEWLAGVEKFFKEADQQKKGRLDEKTIAQALNRLFPPPPGFGPPGKGPDGPPGGFGPGTFLAGAIMKRAGAGEEGKLTLADLLKAADAYFSEIDMGKKGRLDEKALAEGINRLFPQAGFGPRPGGPGGFGPPPFGRPPLQQPQGRPESPQKEKRP